MNFHFREIHLDHMCIILHFYGRINPDQQVKSGELSVIDFEAFTVTNNSMSCSFFVCCFPIYITRFVYLQFSNFLCYIVTVVCVIIFRLRRSGSCRGSIFHYNNYNPLFFWDFSFQNTDLSSRSFLFVCCFSSHACCFLEYIVGLFYRFCFNFFHASLLSFFISISKQKDFIFPCLSWYPLQVSLCDF